MALTRLPGSKWWVETDDVTNEIVATYNKAFIVADIQAIKNTLLLYPNTTQDATDMASVLTAIKNTTWLQTRKDRVTMLTQTMYMAYQDDPKQLEAGQLTSRLNDLIALMERLV